MQEIKLPESLLLEVQDLQNRITESVLNIGQVSLMISQAEMELEILKQEYKKKITSTGELQEEQRSLSEKIISEYGEGNLNISTGLYTTNRSL